MEVLGPSQSKGTQFQPDGDSCWLEWAKPAASSARRMIQWGRTKRTVPSAFLLFGTRRRHLPTNNFKAWLTWRGATTTCAGEATAAGLPPGEPGLAIRLPSRDLAGQESLEFLKPGRVVDRFVAIADGIVLICYLDLERDNNLTRSPGDRRDGGGEVATADRRAQDRRPAGAARVL